MPPPGMCANLGGPARSGRVKEFSHPGGSRRRFPRFTKRVSWKRPRREIRHYSDLHANLEALQAVWTTRWPKWIRRLLGDIVGITPIRASVCAGSKNLRPGHWRANHDQAACGVRFTTISTSGHASDGLERGQLSIADVDYLKGLPVTARLASGWQRGSAPPPDEYLFDKRAQRSV